MMPLKSGALSEAPPMRPPSMSGLAKTVSDKQYSTSYTAGIVSWICVAVGVIVVAAVLISTKVGGKKI